MKKVSTVKAKAKCNSFDIEITATFTPRGLTAAEVEDISKKLKHKFTQAVSTLPFAHVYPHEVRVR